VAKVCNNEQNTLLGSGDESL